MRIAIFGASGFAREVAWLANFCHVKGERVSPHCFIDADTSISIGNLINDIPVMSLAQVIELDKNIPCIVAVGNPVLREKIATEAEAVGLKFTQLIHNNIALSPYISLEEGVVICAGTVLTTNIKIGKHVHVNVACSITHDVEIGDFTTISPGVNIAGNVKIGQRVFIGAGATVINGSPQEPLIIGDNAFIAAGACVMQNVPADVKLVPVPSRFIK